MSFLAANSYGKAAIRLVTVARHGPRHELRDLTVSIRLEGDFGPAHVAGDNASVLPTDTMKNTVYALARAHMGSPLEEFGEAIGERLLQATPAASKAVVELAAHVWDRVRISEHPHEQAFMRGAPYRRTARVTNSRSGVRYEAGIAGLALLKTRGSAFSGFLRDEYTTLRDTEDRLLATELDARWRYFDVLPPFDFAWRTVRDALVETFAEHDSKSVQHTLYAMGTAAVERCDALEEIHLMMPNQHHVPVDLTPFGQENRNEVFVATREPHGLIEATIRRT